MAIVIESATFTRTVGRQTSFVVDMPATRPDGDLYIFLGGMGNSVNWSVIPANWTELVFQGNTPAGCAAHHWLGDSEPATYTLSQNFAASWCVVYRISGFKASAPINTFGSTGITDTNVPLAPVTTTLANCLILAGITVDAKRVNGTPTTTDASGSSSDVESEVDQIGYGACHFTQVLSGTIPSNLFTHASNQTAAVTIAIAPDTSVPLDRRGDTFFAL